MMDRQQGRRAIEGVISEGERLCTSLNERMCAPHALGNHDPGRLNGNHVSIAGLVGAYAGTDVHNGAGIGKPTRKCSSNPLVGTPIVPIVLPDSVVQRRCHFSPASEMPNAEITGRSARPRSSHYGRSG